MTLEPEQLRDPVMIPEDMAGVDDLLAQRVRNTELRQKAERKAARKIARFQSRIDKIEQKKFATTIPLENEDEEIDHILTGYLLKRRKSILRRFGKTIKLTHGVITWAIRARDVDTTADTSDAVRFLQQHPDGDQYLIKQPDVLNKRALATCMNENLLRGLRRRGVRVSKHEFLHVKPTGFQKAILLSRRLYPRRR